MQRKLFLGVAAVSLALIAGTVAHAQSYPTAVQALNPVGYWPLNETTQPPFGAYIATNLGTAGVSGNGYYESWFQPFATGTNTIYYQTNNILHVAGATSDGDTAMSCTHAGAGTGQFVVFPRTVNGVPNSAVTLVPPFAIEVWVYPTTTTTTVMPIVNQGREPVIDASTGYLANNEEGFSVGQYGTIFFFATWNNRGGDSTKQEIDTALTANAWQHMVINFDGTNQTWFKNGVQVGTRAIPASAANAAGQRYTPDLVNPLLIGTGSIIGGGNGASEFGGNIDEVAIYTNTLDAASIATHYALAYGTNTDGSPAATSYSASVVGNNPNIYLRLDEPSMPASSYPSASTYPVANNLGSAGAAANGFYQPGTTPGVSGPSYGGFGVSSKAVAINGYSGAVDIGAGNLPSILNPTSSQPVTVAAWFQGNPADAAARFQSILSHGGSSWRVALDNNAGLRFNPGANPEVQFYSLSDISTNGANVNDGKWHFVAGVSDGTTDSLYIDGVLARSSNGVASITGSTIDALIGGDPTTLVPVWNGGATSQPRYFDGQIAQVAFWTNALTAAQIQQLYAAAQVPPYIVLQPPTSQTNNAGQAVTLAVGARGSANLVYQWYKNNSKLTTATSSSLTFNPIGLSDAGSYYVVVTNSYGSVTSTVAQLTVNGPPVISQQSPTDERVFVGTLPTLRMAVTGPTPISYQWSKNGTAISGATTSSYSPSTTTTGSSTYSCTATNAYGSATINTITVAVQADPTAPYPVAVLNDHPMDYFRLDESAGTTSYDYAGGLNANYTNTTLGQLGYTSGFNPQTDATETSAFFGPGNDSYAGNGSTLLNFAAPTGSSVAFSVEAWINSNGSQPNSDAGLVTIGYGFGGEQFALDCGAKVNSTRTVRFYVNDASGATHGVASTVDSVLTDSAWHHVVAICDEPNGKVSLYVDGILNSTATIGTTAGIRSLTAPVAIGARLPSANDTSYTNQFIGNIDDVSIYNVALTSNQVVNHYLAAGIAPKITQQPPVNLVTNEGSTAVITAAALGTAPLSYQWFDPNNLPIASGTNASLVLKSVSQSQSGVYTLTVTNLYGTVTSGGCSLQVNAGPPILSADLQPLFYTNYAGTPFSYSVTVDGSAPLAYQWTRNGATIPGATNSSYSFIMLAGVSGYAVTVTNSHGSISSSTATNVGVTAPTLDPLAYGTKMKITFSGYNRGEVLANFPALVKLGTNLPSFSFSQFASATGGDLRFTDSTGTNEIPHEIDEWNNNGMSSVWVQIRQLASTNDYIWAYWGNHSATTPEAWSTNGEVWAPKFNPAAGYQIVYHLKEGALPFADSTTLHPATNGVAPAATNGIVGTGGYFNGGSWLEAGTNNLDDAFTLSTWLNVNPGASSINTIWANQHGGYGAPGFALFINDYGTTPGDQVIDLASGDGAGGGNESKTAVGTVSFGNWHQIQVAVNRTNGTAEFFLDGSDIYSSAAIVKDFTNTMDTMLGRFVTDGFFMNGVMDEARIQNGTASPNWVWADYMTVANNSGFETYSTITASGVTLTGQLLGGKLVLTWSQGTLQAAPSVTGTYNDLTGVTSPYTNTPSLGQQFFRVKVR